MNTAGGKTGRSPAWTRRQTGFYKGVGERLRSARLGKSITQEALANLVGLTRTSLTNIEKGRQKILLHTFADIASALGVQPEKLRPPRQSADKPAGA